MARRRAAAGRGQPSQAHPRRILVIGATSAIAQALERRWAARGDTICLVGRSAERLDIVADDLMVRGAARVTCRTLDFRDLSAFTPLIQEIGDELGSVDVALVAHGQLTDQARAESDAEYLADQLHVNLVSAVVAISAIASRLEAQRSGTIIVIGSVAGDRGRRSNHVYGTAKAGLAVFTDGLRGRLRPSGVRVLLVKPGRVDTPMTASLGGSALSVQPETVARDVLRALRDGEDVVYSPFWWKYVMAVIRALPRRVFLRLPL